MAGPSWTTKKESSTPTSSGPSWVKKREVPPPPEGANVVTDFGDGSYIIEGSGGLSFVDQVGG